ncbi:MAG: hypothetical protein V3V97_19435, partial [Hyphomicrobiaceae bacterium]
TAPRDVSLPSGYLLDIHRAFLCDRIKAERYGVETPEQVDLLAKLDCDEVQGYYLGRPMPESDIAAFVISNFAAVIGLAEADMGDELNGDREKITS